MLVTYCILLLECLLTYLPTQLPSWRSRRGVPVTYCILLPEFLLTYLPSWRSRRGTRSGSGRARAARRQRPCGGGGVVQQWLVDQWTARLRLRLAGSSDTTWRAGSNATARPLPPQPAGGGLRCHSGAKAAGERRVQPASTLQLQLRLRSWLRLQLRLRLRLRSRFACCGSSVTASLLRLRLRLRSVR